MRVRSKTIPVIRRVGGLEGMSLLIMISVLVIRRVGGLEA